MAGAGGGGGAGDVRSIKTMEEEGGEKGEGQLAVGGWRLGGSIPKSQGRS